MTKKKSAAKAKKPKVAPKAKAAPKRSASDVKAWLKENGHGKVLALIEKAEKSIAKAKSGTQRSWWWVLAGTPSGGSRVVNGVVFPVLAAARVRAGMKPAKTAIGKATNVPKVAHRWSKNDQRRKRK